MLELFLATDNLPFSIALVVMFGIAILEGITSFIGFGFSQFLENLSPDVDIDAGVDLDTDVDVDIGADTHIGGQSVFTRVFGWIKVKDVPIIVVLVSFLTIFSLSGFVIQSAVRDMWSTFLPWYIAIVPSLLITFPLVRTISKFLARIVLKDETSVVSEKSFIGQTATINLGTAKKGLPAEAKLTDEFGQVHYIMVEPEESLDAFEKGEEVLLIRHEKNIFKAIAAPYTSSD